ncbi:MAG: 3-hydroxyacyl-CoA dehydrogenase NAD-binding domain-containing protein [Campylobacterales bacterium]|nr:3-hydroxyacyl-CoA dehydrogenase NAD-binding domain-containing protein [Campylobacterales bacterium]
MKNIHLNINNEKAELIFDLEKEKINKLSYKVLEELDKTLDEIKDNKGIKLLTIKSAKENIFIAGADINEIKEMKNEKEIVDNLLRGDKIFEKLENLPFPTIAYIDGACMGGGLELTLSCTYRVSIEKDKTKLGLPEVNLGVIPGLGGTQRLPKLIGLANALPLILGGKILNSKQAYKLGILDEYFPDGYEEFMIKDFENLVINNPKEILKRRKKFFPLELFGFTRGIIFKKAKESVIKKTKGHYPAPLVALDVIEKTYTLSLSNGLEIEAEEFSKLATTDISKNLIDIFFTSEELKHKDFKTKTTPIKDSAVIGGGTMGSGIIWLFSKVSLPVRVKLRDINKAGEIMKKVSSIYDFYIKRRKYNRNQVEFKLNKVTFSEDYNGYKDCDLVVEAVVENIDVKKEVYKNLEEVLKDNAIIASNTSSISMENLSSEMKNPERFVGVHFFNPVERMPLVEIIPSSKTSKETIGRVYNFLLKTGKTPVVVGDCSGFLVNRILIPYINEAIYLFKEGASSTHIDKTLTDFGMPMGPLTLVDEVGIDIGYKVSKILEDSYGERMAMCPITESIYKEKNLLGKKAGKGFYIHSSDKTPPIPNPEVSSLQSSNDSFTQAQIIDRTVLMLINEASRCIEEKVVEKPSYLDMAMIMGTGFPPFKGGVLKYADSIGIDTVVEKLEDLGKNYSSRFTPSNLLKSMAKENKTFYGEKK